MKIQVDPLQSAGPFSFGMSPAEVRHAAGVPFRSFKRTPTSAHPSDHFSALGTFAYYDASGRLEALELATPARPLLQGEDLMGVPLSRLKWLLQKHDSALECGVDGVTSHTLGIAAFAPLAKDDEQAPSESIVVFQAGYYGR